MENSDSSSELSTSKECDQDNDVHGQEEDQSNGEEFKILGDNLVGILDPSRKSKVRYKCVQEAVRIAGRDRTNQVDKNNQACLRSVWTKWLSEYAQTTLEVIIEELKKNTNNQSSTKPSLVQKFLHGSSTSKADFTESLTLLMRIISDTSKGVLRDLFFKGHLCTYLIQVIYFALEYDNTISVRLLGFQVLLHLIRSFEIEHLHGLQQYSLLTLFAFSVNFQAIDDNSSNNSHSAIADTGRKQNTIPNNNLVKYSLKDVCIFNIPMNDKASWSIPKCERPQTLSTELHFLEEVLNMMEKDTANMRKWFLILSQTWFQLCFDRSYLKWTDDYFRRSDNVSKHFSILKGLPLDQLNISPQQLSILRRTFLSRMSSFLQNLSFLKKRKFEKKTIPGEKTCNKSSSQLLSESEYILILDVLLSFQEDKEFYELSTEIISKIAMQTEGFGQCFPVNFERSSVPLLSSVLSKIEESAFLEKDRLYRRTGNYISCLERVLSQSPASSSIFEPLCQRVLRLSDRLSEATTNEGTNKLLVSLTLLLFHFHERILLALIESQPLKDISLSRLSQLRENLNIAITSLLTRSYVLAHMSSFMRESVSSFFDLIYSANNRQLFSGEVIFEGKLLKSGSQEFKLEDTLEIVIEALKASAERKVLQNKSCISTIHDVSHNVLTHMLVVNQGKDKIPSDTTNQEIVNQDDAVEMKNKEDEEDDPSTPSFLSMKSLLHNLLLVIPEDNEEINSNSDEIQGNASMKTSNYSQQNSLPCSLIDAGLEDQETEMNLNTNRNSSLPFSLERQSQDSSMLSSLLRSFVAQSINLMYNITMLADQTSFKESENKIIACRTASTVVSMFVSVEPTAGDMKEIKKKLNENYLVKKPPPQEHIRMFLGELLIQPKQQDFSTEIIFCLCSAFAMKNHLKVTFSASQYEPLFDLLAEIERMEFFTSADIVFQSLVLAALKDISAQSYLKSLTETTFGGELLKRSQSILNSLLGMQQQQSSSNNRLFSIISIVLGDQDFTEVNGLVSNENQQKQYFFKGLSKTLLGFIVLIKNLSSIHPSRLISESLCEFYETIKDLISSTADEQQLFDKEALSSLFSLLLLTLIHPNSSIQSKNAVWEIVVLCLEKKSFLITEAIQLLSQFPDSEGVEGVSKDILNRIITSTINALIRSNTIPINTTSKRNLLLCLQKWLFNYSYFETNAQSSMPSSFLVNLVRAISHLVSTSEELLPDINFFLSELLKSSVLSSKGTVYQRNNEQICNTVDSFEILSSLQTVQNDITRIERELLFRQKNPEIPRTNRPPSLPSQPQQTQSNFKLSWIMPSGFLKRLGSQEHKQIDRLSLLLSNNCLAVSVNEGSQLISFLISKESKIYVILRDQSGKQVWNLHSRNATKAQQQNILRQEISGSSGSRNAASNMNPFVADPKDNINYDTNLKFSQKIEYIVMNSHRMACRNIASSPKSKEEQDNSSTISLDFLRKRIKEFFEQEIPLLINPQSLCCCLDTTEDNYSSIITQIDQYSTSAKVKIGVVYLAKNCSNEQEVFSATSGSEQYNMFLEKIGKKIKLSTHQGFMGGLSSDRDGEATIYSCKNINCEVIFHVATMMPKGNKDDVHFVSKKRHIGNDFVNIVWNESGQPFNPNIIPSQLTRAYVIIEPCHQDLYCLNLISKDIEIIDESLLPWKKKIVYSEGLLPNIARILAVQASQSVLCMQTRNYSSSQQQNSSKPFQSRQALLSRLYDSCSLKVKGSIQLFPISQIYQSPDDFVISSSQSSAQSSLTKD